MKPKGCGKYRPCGKIRVCKFICVNLLFRIFID